MSFEQEHGFGDRKTAKDRLRKKGFLGKVKSAMSKALEAKKK